MIDVATIIFAVALLGMVGMILLKILEVKGGKRSILSRLGESTDHHVHDAYDKVAYFLKHINKRTAIALVQWIAFHILTWVREAYLWLRQKAHNHPHTRKVLDMVAGRGTVHKGGGASFYLKHISADAKMSGVHTPVEAGTEQVVSEGVAQNQEK